MISKIKTFLKIGENKKPKTDFSGFFYDASSRDKKKLLEQVVREANKDQRDLVEQYNLKKKSIV